MLTPVVRITFRNPVMNRYIGGQSLEHVERKFAHRTDVLEIRLATDREIQYIEEREHLRQECNVRDWLALQPEDK